MLEKGEILIIADASGSTALHVAAKGRYLYIVNSLADSFAPIGNMRNAEKTNSTPSG